MTGFVQQNVSAHEIAGMGRHLGGTGKDFAGRARAAVGEHDRIATPEAFGTDKLGAQFLKTYGEAPHQVLKAMATFGDQLEEIGKMVADAALTQFDAELENLRKVNNVQT
ncbi:hypothetical protein [Amycolatopsis granulosa]|uniref:hypothetical protein n=1 Tax=Amycolatopsis granulosa TaxID=185684 RepID=UPI00141FA378|nr:hypothetical protein [Amycolatopsis granulosa]NIH84491.1 hypothetical protein [Amycolatopsis granulosa]